MTAAEVQKAKWATALLMCGRTEDAKHELLELIAATTNDMPELLEVQVPTSMIAHLLPGKPA